MANSSKVAIDIAASFSGKKAFKSAEKSILGLSKKALGLAGIGTSLSVIATKGLAAAMADAKSQKQLAQALYQSGNALSTIDVEGFISDLSNATGTADDLLRPALESLLRTNGNVAKSQELLSLALDISARTGADLTTVTDSLSKAQQGNLKGLNALNLGLDKGYYATHSMAQITEELTKIYGGAAVDATKTWQGQLQVLKVTLGEVSESIGYGLVTAIDNASGSNGIENLSTSFRNFGIVAGEEIAKLGDKIHAFGVAIAKDPVFGKLLLMTIDGWNQILGISERYRDDLIAANNRRLAENTHQLEKYYAEQDAQEKIRLANQQKLAKADAARIAALKKQTALEKAKKQLTQASATFDLTKIQLAAALQNTYDKDAKLRLLAMQAIENENGEQALAYIKQMGLLTSESQAAKLQGITTIGQSELTYINNVLQDQLDSINRSKMAEEDKAAARQKAYAQYISAIQESGGLAAANSYNEQTQIDLIRIAKMAALDDVASAETVLAAITESIQLGVIDKVRLAQKDADLARMNALLAYLELLDKTYTIKVNTDLSGAGNGGGGGGSGNSMPPKGNGGGFGWSLPDYLNGTLPFPVGSPSGGNTQVVNIQIPDTATVITQSDFIDAVTTAVNEANSYGYSLTPRGAILP
jgi:hypothetical protein